MNHEKLRKNIVEHDWPLYIDLKNINKQADYLIDNINRIIQQNEKTRKIKRTEQEK